MLLPRRPAIALTALIQGLCLLALHLVLESRAWPTADLFWAIPLYVLALVVPATFNILCGEFPRSRALAGGLALGALIALTGLWFGWSGVTPVDSAMERYSLFADVLVFGASSFCAWFIALPFLQGALRMQRLSFPYPHLFDDVWRNAQVLSHALLFAGGFWLLLGLWAGLFAVLRIDFFQDVFTSPKFAYPATSLVMGLAIALEDHRAPLLSGLRTQLLGLQTRLLPLAAVILLLFLAALPFAGLQPLWDTGHATPLMLCLQFALLLLVNAAWQDGERPAPFSRQMQTLIRLALLTLPVLAALCAWSLSLRLRQYGWTVDRVWAVILVSLASLSGLAYAACASRPGWLPGLGRYNTGIVLILLAALLAVHSPLLDPRRISAASQLQRLLSGRVDSEHFDYDYLRFDLGRAGQEALHQLARLSGHPSAAAIQAKAREALARKARYGWNTDTTPESLLTRLQIHPPGAMPDPAFGEYLSGRINRDKEHRDYLLSSLRGTTPIILLAIDLGNDPGLEYVLLSPPYLVFTREPDGWRQVGQLQFQGIPPSPSEVEKSLANHDYAVEPRRWNDLKLGGRIGSLLLLPAKSEH